MRENRKAHLIARRTNDDNPVHLRPQVCAPFTPDVYGQDAMYHIFRQA